MPRLDYPSVSAATLPCNAGLVFVRGEKATSSVGGEFFLHRDSAPLLHRRCEAAGW